MPAHNNLLAVLAEQLDDEVLKNQFSRELEVLAESATVCPEPGSDDEYRIANTAYDFAFRFFMSLGPRLNEAFGSELSRLLPCLKTEATTSLDPVRRDCCSRLREAVFVFAKIVERLGSSAEHFTAEAMVGMLDEPAPTVEGMPSVRRIDTTSHRLALLLLSIAFSQMTMERAPETAVQWSKRARELSRELMPLTTIPPERMDRAVVHLVSMWAWTNSEVNRS